MADLWSHQYCLACDKQVDSASAAYCSEACRLTELERTTTPSTASTPASSPGLDSVLASDPWGVPSPSNAASSSAFYLTPAYDFAGASTRSASTSHQLTSSSSNTSLSSMGSTSTAGDASQLSSRARQELQAYAVSFDHVRSQRRRSY